MFAHAYMCLQELAELREECTEYKDVIRALFSYYSMTGGEMRECMHCLGNGARVGQSGSLNITLVALADHLPPPPHTFFLIHHP